VIPRVAAMLVAADNDGKSVAAGVEGRVAKLRDGNGGGGGAAAGAAAWASAATVVAPVGGGEVLVAAVGASPVVAAAPKARSDIGGEDLALASATPVVAGGNVGGTSVGSGASAPCCAGADSGPAILTRDASRSSAGRWAGGGDTAGVSSDAISVPSASCLCSGEVSTAK
jgi:hypothetical protein